jgi:hypothetical protein
MEYKPMPSTAVEEVANRLRAEVLAGYFGTVGQLPPKSDLVRHYRASRNSIEQAIKRLQQEGLLTMKNRRLFVIGTSPKVFLQSDLEQQEQVATVSKLDTILVFDRPFYVYTHSYPEGILAPDGHDLSGIVFYVGKGTVAHSHQTQRIDIHEQEARCLSDSQSIYSINKYTCNTIRWIWKQGRNVVKQVIFESADEMEAFDFESQMIKRSASPYLTNFQQNPFAKQRILLS